MSIVISQIPNTNTFDVWINSTRLILSINKLMALHDAVNNALRLK